MGRITVLPYWRLPNTLPSVYDTESGSWIEMAGKLYGAIRELQTDYNSFVDETNQAITDFINSTDKDQEEFKNNINKIMHNYIAMIDEKIKMQDSVIAEAVEFMKTNLSNSITELLADMQEQGKLNALILNSFNTLDSRVDELENIIPTCEYKQTTETLILNNIGGVTNE